MVREREQLSCKHKEMGIIMSWLQSSSHSDRGNTPIVWGEIYARQGRKHAVLGHPITGPFPEDTLTLYCAAGCFWGVEEIFWSIPGVYTTFVGYSGGKRAHPSYEQVCSSATGHTETVGVVYSPDRVSTTDILATFWQSHDATQWMRQGNDVGSQYRSAIFTTNEQQYVLAQRTAQVYQQALDQAHAGTIVTQIEPLTEFYYAEDYHQQYLHFHPMGYRCHSLAHVPFPKEDVAGSVE